MWRFPLHEICRNLPVPPVNDETAIKIWVGMVAFPLQRLYSLANFQNIATCISLWCFKNLIWRLFDLRFTFPIWLVSIGGNYLGFKCFHSNSLVGATVGKEY